MAKDKKKAKSAEQKAAKAAKQTKKAAKGEKKAKNKAADIDSDGDENVDLDAVLAAYAEEQAKFLKVTETPCGPPSPRSSATFIASPANRNELFLFGGEYYDGVNAQFYNDLFVYGISHGEWKVVTSPNSPLPRSGHAWCRGGNTGGIYLFGGEFSSPKQGTFYHYNDFWHLDPDTREWTRLEAKGKGKTPPQRSGHRMTYWKGYVILFGGFQDTSQQTKYLQDAWVYDVRENVWHEFKLPPASQKPDARSSFTFLPHDSGAVLYGGYSRVKAVVKTKGKGGSAAHRNVLKPMVHEDTWFLRITVPPTEAAAGTPPGMRWERRKKPSNGMNPARAGVTMAYHKGRGIVFGGVHDVEESEEGIDSEFFSEAFIYNIDRNRMFPLALRRPKTGGKQRNQPIRGRNRGKADEEELLRNLALLETKGSIADSDGMEVESQTTTLVEEEEDDKKEYPVRFEFPHARFNALLTVQEDSLYIYGGTFERKDTEVTFSDLYAIDMNKLEGVKELYYTEPPNLNTIDQESEDEDEDMDVDDEGDDEDDDMSDNDKVDEVFSPTESVASSGTDLDSLSRDQALETEADKLASQDPRPFPRPFESRADFFRRTTNEWQKYMLDYVRDASELSVKELREKAFSQAEERWWDCREEVQALEDEQEAAGIRDIVSLADRAEAGGAGRRR